MTTLSKIPAGVIDPVKKKAAEVIAATGNAVTHVWGYNTVPDHNNKKCVDFMVGSKAAGDKVATYLRANAKRLGVVGIIWYRQVMGFPSNGTAYRGPEGQWRAYTGPSPHTDHVHVEFNAGGYSGAPAADAKPKPKPAPAPKPKPSGWDGKSFPGAGAFKIGQSHPAVTVLGQRLVAHGFGRHYKVGPGPTFSEVDRKNCQEFQLAQGYVGTQKGGGADGFPGPQTWAALMKAPKKAKPKGKTIGQLAQEVIDGKWGNDPARSKKLKAAGHDPKKVQAEVNRRLR